MVFNTLTLFGVYILDMDNPRYVYHRLGRFPVLCAVLELMTLFEAYFIMSLIWGFFFVMVPMVSVYWLRNML